MGLCPSWELRGLSCPHETAPAEVPLPSPAVAVHPRRASSSCRASATSSPDSMFSDSPGCSSHGLGRATASSHCGLVARGHVCPKSSSAMAWFLPTSHSLEPQSPPHLVIQWSRCFSPKLVTQHMACYSLGGKELERFAQDVMLGCWRPSQPCPPQHPSSYAFAMLFYFLLPSAYASFSWPGLWL